MGLAVGVTGLAAPMANADAVAEASQLNPMTTLDSLVVSNLPEDHRAALPRPSRQLNRKASTRCTS